MTDDHGFVLALCVTAAGAVVALSVGRAKLGQPAKDAEESLANASSI
ncbi:hypothetical protein [Cohnella terricola]|nr:hypothetical protein [Cohnella terricola]